MGSATPGSQLAGSEGNKAVRVPPTTGLFFFFAATAGAAKNAHATAITQHNTTQTRNRVTLTMTPLGSFRPTRLDSHWDTAKAIPVPAPPDAPPPT
jgi:hypothetical protein